VFLNFVDLPQATKPKVNYMGRAVFVDLPQAAKPCNPLLSSAKIIIRVEGFLNFVDLPQAAKPKVKYMSRADFVDLP
jgi:hypothetical protein